MLDYEYDYRFAEYEHEHEHEHGTSPGIARVGVSPRLRGGNKLITHR